VVRDEALAEGAGGGLRPDDEGDGFLVVKGQGAPRGARGELVAATSRNACTG
jgi:hypothetical protein